MKINIVDYGLGGVKIQKSGGESKSNTIGHLYSTNISKSPNISNDTPLVDVYYPAPDRR